MFNPRSIFSFEKKSVFVINLFLILLVILFLSLNISLKYFFYIDIIITFILSYFFFLRSKKLAKMLILTNMFILFYFLFPEVSSFLTWIFGPQSYLLIILYNVFIAFLFLNLSGYREQFLGSYKNFNWKLLILIILISFTFGLLFTFVKEPLPKIFTSIYKGGFDATILFLIGSSFAVAFSEQTIFTGFLFNVYKNLTDKFDASLQVSTLFVMFHILRFNLLMNYYKVNFGNSFIIFLGFYYILLFLFMNTCIYFYSINSKNYKGNFYYPVLIHFLTDFSLFAFTIFGI